MNIQIKTSRSKYNKGIKYCTRWDLAEENSSEDFYLIVERESNIVVYGGISENFKYLRPNRYHQAYPENFSEISDKYMIYRFVCSDAKKYESAFLQMAQNLKASLWNTQYKNGTKVFKKYTNRITDVFEIYNFKL